MSSSLPHGLIDYMQQQGYRPEPLKPSGSGFLRFSVNKEANGNLSGYVKVFPDGMSATFGDFKSGTHFLWSARNEKSMTPTERKAHQDAMRKIREEIEEERCRLQAAAANKAANIYEDAEGATAGHPYLLKKGINPCGGIRQSGKQLLIPIHIEGKLTSLQIIEEDGTKRFFTNGEIKGGYCILGIPGAVICIAEGYATACSIHEATGDAAAVAFNAGNLMPVAQALRSQYKDATLILCSDHDQWTEGNPGLTKAREAALAVDGLLAVPDFSGCDLSSKPTDFNDLHVLAGKEAVSRALSAAARGVDIGGPGAHPGPAHQEVDQTREPVGNGLDMNDQHPDSNAELLRKQRPRM